MKYLFDSSVLIAAFLEQHPMHTRAFPWLKKAKTGEIEWIVAGHSIAEVYSVLTTLPASPKMSPAMAEKLISKNIPKHVIISLATSEYLSVIKSLSNQGLIGGIVYDALIDKVGVKSKVDKILTFNIKDFEKISKLGKENILSP